MIQALASASSAKSGIIRRRPLGFDHLDADAPVLLRDQTVDRINHAEHSSLPVVHLNRLIRVPPLLLVVYERFHLCVRAMILR